MTMQTFVDALVLRGRFLLAGITVCVAAVLSKVYFWIYECGLVLCYLSIAKNVVACILIVWF